MRVGDDVEVGSLLRCLQKRNCGALPAALCNGEVVPTKTLLLGPVEVISEWITSGLTCTNECVEQRVLHRATTDANFAVLAMKIVAAVQMLFRATEVGQHIVVRPALAT